MPNLLALQTESFDWLIGNDAWRARVEAADPTYTSDRSGLDEILTRMTMPLLRPFRRILPPHKTAGIDWSPMLLLLAIFIIRGLIGAALARTV